MTAFLDQASLAALFRSVVVQSHDVVLVTEAEPVDAASGGPKVVYVNPAFTQMTGYDFQDIVGLTPRLLQSPLTDQGQLAKIRVALARWEPVEVELLNVRKDGSQFWVQISISPAADERGWYTHWIAIQREITDRRQRELQVQAMLASTSDLMMLIDRGGHITGASPSAHEVLGRDPAALLGLPVGGLVHAAEVAALRAMMTPPGGLRLGPGAQVQARLAHGDGSWRWMQLTAVDLPEHQAGVVVLACVDVTERRQAAAALQLMNDKFRSAFVDAPVGMALTDETGRFLQVNSALVDLLGRSAAELVGLQLDHLATDRSSAGPVRDSGALAERQYRQKADLLHADGRIIQVLHSWSLVPGESAAGHGHFIDHFEDITARMSYQLQLQHQALHDPLTGLANRALLADRIDQALSTGQREDHTVAVLFLDLDRFKAVNDSLGHAAGDTVLIEVASRLRQAIRPQDTVARLGGDEFVVLSPNCTPEQAVDIAGRVLARLSVPLTAGPVAWDLTASIGIAVARRGHSTCAALLRDADAAMYAAKDRGRNRIEVFDGTLGGQLHTRLQLHTQLRRAIPAGELRLYYQPIFRLTGGPPVGVEALVRWQHPERGLLPPAAFLELAEESDLIVQLGGWVLGEAIQAAQRLQRRWKITAMAPPVTWVNLSGHQLQDPTFPALVGGLLSDSGLPGSALGVEMTESVLISDLDRTRTTLTSLRQLGMQVAIDDFGTGYSSLSYLAQFPVDVVKIDRSFVAGLDDDTTRRESYAIINAVVGLAHALHLEVVAEGIETLTQAQALHGLGCSYGQGFLLGRPGPEDPHLGHHHAPRPGEE